jgi:transcriptional regulator with XRE-family HTH domain
VISDTLSDGLKAYGIGATLRALRLKKKMGLVELGKHTGLSPALLSKLERGLMFPTLPTLLRVAMVFGIGLDHFFAGSRDTPALAVVRRSERRRFPDLPGSRRPSYYFESLDFPVPNRRLNAYLADFQAVSAEEASVHTHEGAEVIYVMEGTVAVTVGEQEHVLQAGDSIYFDPAPPHSYRRIGRRPCRAVISTTA